jgi:chromosome segregation ATPase
MSFEYHHSQPDWGKPRSSYTATADLHAELTREYSRIDLAAKSTLEKLQAKRDGQWLKVPFAGDSKIKEITELRHRCKVTFEDCVKALLHQSQMERQQADAEKKLASDSTALDLATKELKRVRGEYDSLSSERLDLSLSRDKQLGALGDTKNKRLPPKEVAVYEAKKLQLEQERKTLLTRFASNSDELAAITKRRIDVESSIEKAGKKLEASRAEVKAFKAAWTEATAAQKELSTTSALGLSLAVSTLADAEKAAGRDLDEGTMKRLVAGASLSDAANERVKRQQADSKSLSRQAATAVTDAEVKIEGLETNMLRLKALLEEQKQKAEILAADAELLNLDFNEPSYDQEADPMELENLLQVFNNEYETVELKIKLLNEEIEECARRLSQEKDKKARREKTEERVKADGVVQNRRRTELEKKCAVVLSVCHSSRNYDAESGATAAAAKVHELSRSIERLTNAISIQEADIEGMRAEKESLQQAEARVKSINQELVVITKTLQQNSKYVSDYNKAQEEVNQTNQKLQSTEQKMKRLDADDEMLTSRTESLRRSIREAGAKVCEAKDGLSSMRPALESIAEDLRKTMIAVERIIDDAR